MNDKVGERENGKIDGQKEEWERPEAEIFVSEEGGQSLLTCISLSCSAKACVLA